MEESFIPKENEKQKKEKNTQKKKKKGFFSCCFGQEQETEDEFDDAGNQQDSHYQHYQDQATTLPISVSTNYENTDSMTNHSNVASKSKAKGSPQKNRNKEESSPNYPNKIIEQGEENQSSSNNSSDYSPKKQRNEQNEGFQSSGQKNNQNITNNSNQKQKEHINSNNSQNDQFDKNKLAKSPKRFKFNIKTYFQQTSYSSGDVFHMYSSNKESYLLVKLMEKNFSSNSILGSQLNIGQSSKQSINQKGVFSSTLQSDPNSYFYNKNFKSDFDSQFNAIPEQICQYLASRLKYSVIIDAFCGVGYNTVQFAKEAHQVFAIDMNSVKVSHAKYNIEQFKAQHKAEVIQADFLQMKRLKGDVVVLHPDYRKNDISTSNEDTIDLLTDVCPNLIESLQISFTIANSVILILQKNCDIQQLPTILNQVNFCKKKFGVEVELLHIDRKFNLAVVYMGEIANISKDEMVEYYTKKLYESTNIQNQTFYNKLYLVLVNLMHTNKMKGVSQLIEDCEKNLLKQKNRKTLFQEFFDTINEKRSGKIRSSGSLQFENEGGLVGNPDKALKQLLVDINQILLTNNRGQKEQHSPSSNVDLDANQNSYSYSKNMFEGEKINVQKKKNKFNQSMQETTNDSSLSGVKSGLAINKLKGINKNQIPKRVEICTNPNITSSKATNTSHPQHQQNASNDQSGQNSYQKDDQIGDNQTNQENEYDQEEFENSFPKIIYSCSYGTNTLVDSEVSENNSLRPQLSNGLYMNSSGDMYDEVDFKNILHNGSNYYPRPMKGTITGSTNSNGAGNTSGSLPNNALGKGQILGYISKNQKHNNSKLNLSGEEQRSASKINMYQQLQQQLQQEEDGDFFWEQQEEETDYTKEKEVKNTQPKIKNNVNTYQHTQDLDDSYKKVDIHTVPNSLS